MSSENKRDDELGALWRKPGGDKPDYFTGSVTVDGTKVDIVVFENGFKKADNHPDYRILKSRPKEERTSTRRDEQQYQKPAAPAKRPYQNVHPPAEEFDSRQMQKPTPRKPAPVADWTDAVPHPVNDDEIPF